MSKVRSHRYRSSLIETDRINPGFYSSTGYRSVRTATHDGLAFSSASGDYHLSVGRTEMLKQARDFARNNAIFAGMIDRAVGYIVGGGFGLQVQSKSKTFNAKAEKLFVDWWKRPEVKGMLSGRGVERMACRELLTVGDTGSVKTNLGLLQLIEAEQIAGRSPNTDGIAKDGVGRPTKFYVAPYGRGGQPDLRRATGYDPENFLFLARPDRPSSTRGAPPCQAAFPMLHRINDTCDSEAIAWQLLARLAVAINREEGATLGHGESTEDPNKTTDTDGELTTRLTELDYALVFHANPGETISGIERNIPGRNFPESLRMFLRLLGLPLGLPLEIVLMDWSKSNYSQSRAVLMQVYHQTFLQWQLQMEDFFLTPAVEWKLAEWVAAGLLGRRDDVRINWIKPTYPWIDELKETEARAKKIALSLTSLGAVCKSLGVEREDVMDAREGEIADAIERAAKLSEKYKVEVPWQLFAGLEVPGGGSANAGEKPAADDDDDDAANKKGADDAEK